jgi:Fe-S-cluster-containing dehydrogenase component
LVACQNQNELDDDCSFIRFEDKETGQFPKVKYTIAPLQCMHCADAPCVSVCPTTASAKDKETGLTLVDKEKCMGCRRCVAACPYNARVFLKEEGIAQGCNLCLSLLKQGQEPACVATCLTKARLFGDLDKPTGEFAKLLPNAKPLRADLKTKPTTLYIVKA